MLERLKSIFPQKLKYRIFITFIILILLPFSILNIYNNQKIETMVQQKISEQSHEQLKNMQRALEDQMSIAFKTLIFLEQDSTLRTVLKSPENRMPLENQRLVEERFQDFNNSFFLYNPSVYFTVLDHFGSVYTSYQPAKQLDYQTTFSQPTFQQVQSSLTYVWVPNDHNYVYRDISTSPSLLSLYSPLKDQSNRPYGLARISIDYTYWFQSMLSGSQSDQEYFIINRQGEQIAGSVQEASLGTAVIEDITASPESGYLQDDRMSSLVIYSYLESLDWYLVNRIPTAVLFDGLNELKQNYFITLFALTIIFVIIAFIIVHAFTRPLTFMQMKMREAVRKNLRVRLPEQKYKGEIFDLAQTYNRMLDDMHELIQRLKVEERKKEAIQFQMLLAQLNPHFLLNTLNTIKWISLRNHNEEIAEITMSLGKLLEASLNSEIDLIHLKDEIELTQAYVYIQKTRYRNLFEVEYDYDDSLQYAILPKLSLQPLVENAIQHGISSMAGQGLIRIRIRVIDAETLCIEVEDNGVGVEQAEKLQSQGRKRPGIGLENIRERLRLLFKNKGKLEVISLEQGTIVRLTLPLLMSPPYGQDQLAFMQQGGIGHVEGATR